MIKCRFESGPETSLRHVTVDGIILKGNSVLLNLRGLYKGKPIKESGKWGLIGGYVNRDENIEQALRREVMEETGCIIDNIRLFRINDNPDRPAEDRQNISFVMIADFVSMKPIESEEVKELQWFDLDELPEASLLAFDHSKNLQQYKEFLKNRASLEEKQRFPGKIL